MEFYLDTYIAHRGLHCHECPECPENSLAAFQEAVNHGYAIELDVHLSSDGHVMVFHDETLTRMTGSNGKVSQYTLKSLKELRLAKGDEEIPTLKEVLDLVQGKVPLVIEIKVIDHDGVLEAEVMKLLHNYDGDYAIQSFNPMTLKWLRKHYPSLTLGLLVTRDFSDTKLSRLKQRILANMTFIPVIRPNYIGLDIDTYSKIQLQIIKRFTFNHLVFWTVRTKEQMRTAKRLGANIIFENIKP
ncbi:MULTISPECIES: glycerophosphodiester phosphodiesterase family protein [Halobacteriovorax]|uniref:Glycerophosphodiester phosphodiesterase n=1 Tax=Halobacteriovorax vibrionivorans TaxID=2152716 RepID=A0ABY0IH96_9BACT|nr:MULTISPECIES: glycerophosphodiester phosphodiesterase family protein [Halobacteriovorax]AYF45229.1 glycerophosphodiester phosphodiesterase family protein [Halobacteriovorax sp. BALOs_7]RZF22318.1 glycerophosphodiester phosphodiesterase [Halobacteriovorax vibrionivorans]TGD48570.1 glycerophosphodiester phosphodiesterase [Halobacteriovorax sp. Y22]